MKIQYLGFIPFFFLVTGWFAWEIALLAVCRIEGGYIRWIPRKRIKAFILIELAFVIATVGIIWAMS